MGVTRGACEHAHVLVISWLLSAYSQLLVLQPSSNGAVQPTNAFAAAAAAAVAAVAATAGEQRVYAVPPTAPGKLFLPENPAGRASTCLCGAAAGSAQCHTAAVAGLHQEQLLQLGPEELLLCYLQRHMHCCWCQTPAASAARDAPAQA